MTLEERVNRIECILKIGQKSEPMDAEDVIREILLELGAPDHLLGHTYMVEALMLCFEDSRLAYNIMEVYPLGCREIWNNHFQSGTLHSAFDRGDLGQRGLRRAFSVFRQHRQYETGKANKLRIYCQDCQCGTQAHESKYLRKTGRRQS